MQPVATRVLRSGRLRWDAWALVPDSGPWFWVCKAWTRRGAQRELRHFVRRIRQYS